MKILDLQKLVPSKAAAMDQETMHSQIVSLSKLIVLKTVCLIRIFLYFFC